MMNTFVLTDEQFDTLERAMSLAWAAAVSGEAFHSPADNEAFVAKLDDVTRQMKAQR